MTLSFPEESDDRRVQDACLPHLGSGEHKQRRIRTALVHSRVFRVVGPDRYRGACRARWVNQSPRDLRASLPGGRVTSTLRRATRVRYGTVPLLAGLVALGCVSACAAEPNAATPQSRASKTAALDKPARARAAPSTPSPFAGLTPYLARMAGYVTAALYDTRTRTTWVFHPGAVQDTASIVKVQIMGTALQEAEAAKEKLPQPEAALMTSMIENSNNQSATDLLQDVGGPGAVALFDHSVGLDHTIPSTLTLIPGTSWPGWGLTTTTAVDQVMLVSKFAYPNSVLSRASRRYGLSLMENIEPDQDWGVSAGLPDGTTVALKNGWLPLGPSDWQVNSIGWIDGHDRNYVLAVLTRGSPTEAYGIETIQSIARAIFVQLGTAAFSEAQ
jgi:hypothetical protein